MVRVSAQQCYANKHHELLKCLVSIYKSLKLISSTAGILLVQYSSDTDIKSHIYSKITQH